MAQEELEKMIAGLFRGERAPRLGGVGRAAISHRTEFDADPTTHEQRRLMVVAMAAHLVPGFDPPQVKIGSTYDIISAYGCGGGTASEDWGDGARGARYFTSVTEHAADDESDSSWTAYGLPGGISVAIKTWERGAGYHILEADGPAPAIFELALAWGRMLADAPWTVEKLRGYLSASAWNATPI
jgi:hypothetical protein